MRHALIVPAAVIAALLVPALGAQVPARPAAAPPLVVLLMVDQFRADYVDWYGRQWTDGLHTLVTRGANFTRAAYPYAATKTCVGHATVSTGTLPRTHGIIENEWFDPTTRQFTLCTEDPSANSLVYGGRAGEEHHSARWLKVPTFADELVRQSGGRARVASMSIKPRSAIMLGGRGGPTSTIVWSEDTGGVWATSTALTRRLSPDVDAFVRANPPNVNEFQTWSRAAADSMYIGPDQAPGEPGGAAGVFPHLFDEPIRTSRSTPALIESWESTPFTDLFLAGLGTYLVEKQQLGRRGVTDLLAISFSSLDTIGHRYGPRSHEVQDTLFRLDKVIGDLLRALDSRIGRDRYVLAFSSDHGVAEMPEQIFPSAAGGRGRGGPGAAPGGGGQEGRASLTAIANAVETLLDKQFGRGSYVEAAFGTYLYFRPGVLGRIQKDPALVAAVEQAMLGARGVDRVYWASEMAPAEPADDPILEALRKSYVPGRSGDIAFVLKRNWMASADAGHGSPYDYDQRVPVIFYGAGVAPGQYSSAATPADIVPTLSAITGVKMPRTDGTTLVEALARP